QAGYRDVLHQQIVHFDGGDPPGSKADDHHAATPGQGTHRGIKDIIAERVQNHIGAMPIGAGVDLFTQAVAQVLGRQVNDVVRAVCAGNFGLFAAVDARQRNAAHAFDQLNGSAAHTPGRTVYQHRFARFELTSL